MNNREKKENPMHALNDPLSVKTVPILNFVNRLLVRRDLLLGALALACFALSQAVQAVSPPPDGGYIGFNTAEGEDALFSSIISTENTALGYHALYHTDSPGDNNTATGSEALFHNISGSFNTATGDGALFQNFSGSNNTAIGFEALAGNVGSNNTATGFQAARSNFQGSNNTADGYQALYFNVSDNNTATGFQALFRNVQGEANTAIGVSALHENSTGGSNTATGFQALFNNKTISGVAGRNNTATGVNALFSNTTGEANTANGSGALFANRTADFNTAMGLNALHENTNGAENTAIGVNALISNIGGDDNTATGVNALFNNTSGNFNTANGWRALLTNSSGMKNTAIGFNALALNSIGSFNTAIGTNALFNNRGNNNIGLGDFAGGNLTAGSNNIDIGAPGVAGEAATIRIGVQGTHTRTFVAGISGSPITGTSVVVNSFGRLGTVASSQRFKDDIKPMDQASEAILALRPVTFHYKKEVDPDGIPQFGLVAEQVEKVNPDLVARDEEGKAYTVRYEAVNAMLLNEFLKTHRKVEEQSRKMQEQEATITRLKATVGEQQKGMEVFAATLKEQASHIQEVSAWIELSKPAPQTVASRQ